MYIFRASFENSYIKMNKKKTFEETALLYNDPNKIICKNFDEELINANIVFFKLKILMVLMTVLAHVFFIHEGSFLGIFQDFRVFIQEFCN